MAAETASGSAGSGYTGISMEASVMMFALTKVIYVTKTDIEGSGITATIAGPAGDGDFSL
ncbi:hypothetical protein [Acetobacter oeni]|nr:hypothetical protein [Acetobacter oeni]MBB3884630.1 hypothetical protein [Acetobacter oeni]